MKPIIVVSGMLLAEVLAPSPTLAQVAAPAPVTLEQALSRFHRDSPALALARSRFRVEAAVSRQGRAFANPVASLSHEDLGDYTERYLTVTQRVDFLWDAPGRARRADALVLGARARFQADSARLVRDVKEAYVRAWESREGLALARRTDEVLASILANAAERAAEGDLAGYDVRRLEVERARVGRSLARAEVELAYAEERLAALVGEPGVPRLAAAPLAGSAPVPGAEVDVVSLALSRRAEVAAARAAVDAQRAGASLARRGMLEGTSVGGGLKRQSDGKDGLFLAVQIPVPILDRRSGAADASRAALTGAEAEAEWVGRAVAIEASLARARVAAAARTGALVGDRGLAEAEELLAVARLAYEEGEVGIVEMLDAAEAFTEAGLLWLGARVEGWLAYFELEQAVGGLADNLEQGVER
ncbi:MAG TPA: TolC family protein [Longimicrobiales bacterium]|nr:TolC family protein [Longimicrobiales bacterium]